MQQVLTDLWQTRTDSPFPGLTTHAFLWTGRNALFYSTATDADFAALDELGGVADQYLSHRDEAGPMLAKIADHFDSTLHAPVTELLEIGQHAHVDVPLGSRHVDVNGIEVVPTPGHSPGSTCYLIHGADGRYLFTGDTMVFGDSGAWWAGYIPGISDADALAASLRLLRTLEPDVAISSAYQGDSAVHRIEAGRWADHVDQAIDGLTASLGERRTGYV
ncbi:MAG TPA: MBL fold metallo-hydrolase [Mycobacterium sp.]|nr:MBL fold metallo-hydrolase [Mycobacterium sp.]